METHYLQPPPCRVAHGLPLAHQQVLCWGWELGWMVGWGWGGLGWAHPHLLPPPTDNSEGALEGMVWGLRQGGVSLLGQPQPLTHEQWRSSFMRRNRDPQLNERVHRVRALQSTLKVSWRALGVVKDWVLGFRLWFLALSSGLSCGLGQVLGSQSQTLNLRISARPGQVLGSKHRTPELAPGWGSALLSG